ncbi:MAG: motility protein MotB [Alphaproteobacteria bacterium]|nr:MAG: motility protein MotB [Alphaproteobacteria bacterium]
MADEENGAGGGGGSGGNGPAVIVIKKKARGGHGGHHGGAWKVAYADFVTAMMAFFLLLWLLASTTKEQKAGIAHYFNPPSNASQYGGGQGIMKGSSVVAADDSAPQETPVMPPAQANMNDDMAVQAKEDAMFRQVSEQLKKAVMNVPELKALMDNMLIDMTPEGLRITVTDSKDRPLFENGSGVMYDYTRKMMGVVTAVLSPLPNNLAIGGHTDVVPYRGANPAYTNWELSNDRANTTRKVMMSEGMTERRIARVAGYASQQPLLVDQPENPKNARITIIILRSKFGTVAKFSQDGLIVPKAGAYLP